MNYTEWYNKTLNAMQSWLGNVDISEEHFYFEELIFSKRIDERTGPVVKTIKRTSFSFTMTGIKENPLVKDQSFIFNLKHNLEFLYGFKFKRIKIEYPDEDTIYIET